MTPTPSPRSAASPRPGPRGPGRPGPPGGRWRGPRRRCGRWRATHDSPHIQSSRGASLARRASSSLIFRRAATLKMRPSVAPSRDRRFLRNPSQPRSGRRIGQFSPAGGTEPGPANVRAGDRALRMSRAGVGVHERRRDEPDGGGTTRPGHPSAANTAMPSTWQVRRRTGPSDTTFLRPPNTSARPNTTRRAKPTSLGASFSAAIARAASPVPP